MNFTNILGTLTAILTVLTGVMTQLLGCTTDAVGVTICASTILPAKYMAISASIFGILTLISKLMRPGGALHSLFGQTAVVVDGAKSAIGTVTKAQVASK
jgi:hypothetical protein